MYIRLQSNVKTIDPIHAPVKATYIILSFVFSCIKLQYNCTIKRAIISNSTAGLLLSYVIRV